ncbi:MAG: hypothetical protein Fur0032_19090 [Terrimicrobiaceae bacterium]
MIDVVYRRGLYLPDEDIWLDPHHAVDRAFVSHAHCDHTGAHRVIYCTPATARLTAARTGLDGSRFETMPYGERREFPGGWSATLFPAGHVLGSAQIFIESARGSLLYTGDFKLRHGLSCEPATATPAETLVMETTYGLPRYVFPPTPETLAEVRKFCFETLEDGGVPVLLAYSLGKAQEILSALRVGGFVPMLHPSIARLAEIYEEFGVSFPPFAKWDARAVQGHVLLCPPAAAGSRALRSIRKARAAALTGWALDPGARFRMGADAAFPLSDHADYPDLLAHVEAVRPDRVLTLHGFAAEFARDLRARGVEAWALTAPNQLEFEATSALSLAGATSPAEIPVFPDGTFDRLASVCEEIRISTGRLSKLDILASFLQDLSTADLEWAALWLTGRALPTTDPRQISSGPAIIRKALSTASGLNEQAVRSIGRSLNDSGITATTVLLSKPSPPQPVSIQECASLLDSLSKASRPVDKISLLAGMLAVLHPVSGSYLIRILTGDLRIGLKEGLVEEALAQMSGLPIREIRQANMLAGHPGRVAVLARENRLEHIQFTPFHPISCMLAGAEPDAESVWKRLGSPGSVWLEPKFDGIRAQIHAFNGCIRIFSREMKDITGSFPEITCSNLLPDCVLDGEILAWEDDQPLPFFDLQKRLGRHDEDLFFSSPVPVVCRVFDILAIGGRLLLNKPLRERRKTLETLPLSHPLNQGEVWGASSPEEIDEAFARARSQGYEGLMAKDPSSLYSPGRRGLSWVKYKKALATLDVVVTAAEFGHGRRSRVLSDLTFAIRKGGEFLNIGKAYTGLTDEQIEALTARFLASAIDRQGNKVILPPEIVIEVAFDSIQPSDRHPSGLALRFPRIKRLRPDKSPQQIDTLASARKLVAGARS